MEERLRGILAKLVEKTRQSTTAENELECIDYALGHIIVAVAPLADCPKCRHEEKVKKKGSRSDVSGE